MQNQTSLYEAELKFTSNKPISPEKLKQLAEAFSLENVTEPKRKEAHFRDDYYLSDGSDKFCIRIRHLQDGEVEMTSKSFLTKYDIRIEPEFLCVFHHKDTIPAFMRNIGFDLAFTLEKRNVILCDGKFDHEGIVYPIQVSSYTAIASYPNLSVKRTLDVFEMEIEKGWLAEQEENGLDIKQVSEALGSIDRFCWTSKEGSLENKFGIERSHSLLSEIFSKHQAIYF
jgi:hypothetical protein